MMPSHASTTPTWVSDWNDLAKTQLRSGGYGKLGARVGLDVSHRPLSVWHESHYYETTHPRITPPVRIPPGTARRRHRLRLSTGSRHAVRRRHGVVHAVHIGIDLLAAELAYLSAVVSSHDVHADAIGEFRTSVR